MADARIFGRRRGLWSQRNNTLVLRKREVIEKVRAQLQRVKKIAGKLRCPECPDVLKTYTFQRLDLDCYHGRGRVWMAKKAVENTRGPLGKWFDKLTSKE